MNTNDFCRPFFKNRIEQRRFMSYIGHRRRKKLFDMVLDWLEVCEKSPASKEAQDKADSISEWIKWNHPSRLGVRHLCQKD